MQRAFSGRDARTLKVLGSDLAAVALTQSLLIRAPLAPEQRAALFALLADAPQWTVPGTSVTPLRVEKAGTDGDATVIRISSHLSADEERRLSVTGDWALELVVDARAGRIVALREYEDGPGKPPQVTTVERQAVVDAPWACPSVRGPTSVTRGRHCGEHAALRVRPRLSGRLPRDHR